MITIGAFEAKNTLGRLLDLAEQGEEIVITRHGKEVARLVSVKGTLHRAQAREAAREIQKMGRGVKLDGLKIKDLIEDGRT